MTVYNMNFTVTKEDTAKEIGSGSLPVLATPRVVAMAEHTCMLSLDEELENGETTVGAFIDIKHLRPTRIGARVKVSCELVQTDGKLFEFVYDVYEQDMLVASGAHKRVKVDSEKFMSQLQ
ncbi:thioesterase family protein [Vagococcus jeotgali]|uniref:thioesterase family protein n=1 Tax=Vagococcus jeotgali TaxID=3109030 RepID=UPI002DD86468|nr:thioesterase family protein [Vagococcus sp. B2T-5]